MKRKLLPLHWLAQLILLLLMVPSCHEEEVKEQVDPKAPLTVSTAEHYYWEQLVPAQGNGVKDSRLANGTPNKKHVMFQKAHTGQNSTLSFVEVPLYFDKHISTILTSDKNPVFDDATKQHLNATFNRLIIFKNKQTGEVNQRIVTYIPDADYLAEHHNDASYNKIDHIAPDYNGYLKYTTWSGTALYILKIKNGKTVNHFVAGLKVAPENAQTNARTKGINCSPVYEEIWERVCAYVDDPHSPDIYVNCSGWAKVGSQLVGYNCVDDGLGGPDYGGGDNPCWDPSNMCGGSIGGGGGDGEGEGGSGDDGGIPVILTELDARGISCGTFNFVKINSNYQESAVLDVHFNVKYIDVNTSTSFERTMVIKRALWFGFPAKTYNGRTISPGEAAEAAAEAVQFASDLTHLLYLENPATEISLAQGVFLGYLKSKLLEDGGRVDFSGSGDSRVIPTVAQYNWFGNGDCD